MLKSKTAELPTESLTLALWVTPSFTTWWADRDNGLITCVCTVLNTALQMFYWYCNNWWRPALGKHTETRTNESNEEPKWALISVLRPDKHILSLSSVVNCIIFCTGGHCYCRIIYYECSSSGPLQCSLFEVFWLGLWALSVMKTCKLWPLWKQSDLKSHADISRSKMSHLLCPAALFSQESA